MSRLPTGIRSSPWLISSQTVFPGSSVADLFPDRLPGVERLARLIDIGEPGGLAEAKLARVGLLEAAEHAKQRGLSRAVRPDHTDDAGRRQREGEPVDEQPLPVALGEIHGFDRDLTEARTGRDRDLDALERALLLLGAQVLVGVEARPAFGLPRAWSHLDPLELALQRATAG
jgi:hypothetical protein